MTVTPAEGRDFDNIDNIDGVAEGRDVDDNIEIPKNQCFGSVWICLILVSLIRIRVAKNQPKSWKISTKNH